MTKKQIAAFSLAVSLIIILPFIPTLSALSQAPVYTIYFYSPETNINNFSSLKMEFDTYLSGHGSYVFQPFSERETFEKYIHDNTNGIYLLSSWHYRKLKDSLSIEAMLVGLLDDKPTQKRILSALHEFRSIDQLRGKKIASASSEEYTLTILAEMVGETNAGLLDEINIFKVPKDIDALMAVGFGMAEAALTTEISLYKLAKINPKQHGRLKPLATGSETLLPIVAAPVPVNDDTGNLIALLTEMSARPGGEKRLKMLGLDGLARIDDYHRSMLFQ